MGQITEKRFEMRLDQNLSDRIDAWSEKQSDMPSRSEAVRRLIEAGLKTTGGTQIAIEPTDKLILSMLCEIYKSMEIKGEFDAAFIQSAIYGGHNWALRWKHEGLIHNYSDDEETLTEVVNILDMWYFLERAYNNLSQEDKDNVKENAKPFGNTVMFPGFDGNNEHKHLNIAHFLIHEMGRFTEFKDRGHRGDLNAHYPTLGLYRRMIDVFIPIRKKLTDRDLNAQEIAEIVNARIHPDHR